MTCVYLFYWITITNILINRTIIIMHAIIIEYYKGLSNLLKSPRLKGDMTGPSTYMATTSVIVGHFPPDFQGWKTSMVSIRNCNKNIFDIATLIEVFYPWQRYIISATRRHNYHFRLFSAFFFIAVSYGDHRGLSFLKIWREMANYYRSYDHIRAGPSHIPFKAWALRFDRPL